MANRRMFSKSIIDTDIFLDMPLSTQALYFHLAMRADDEGFVANVKKIMRMINSTEDDYRILLSKNFIIKFETGVCVITHWRIHNYIQKDRYHDTIYKQEKKLLKEIDSVYEMDTECIQSVDSGKVRLGKSSQGKNSQDKGRVQQKEKEFDRFWSMYPKKKSKGQAEKAWKKINLELYDTIFTALERYKQSKDWTKADGKYIPYPATWLNAKGWEDDIDMTADKATGIRELV